MNSAPDYYFLPLKDAPAKVKKIPEIKSLKKAECLVLPDKKNKNQIKLKNYKLDTENLFICAVKNSDTNLSLFLSGRQKNINIFVVMDNCSSLTILCHQNPATDYISINQKAFLDEGASIYWQNITLGGGKTEHHLTAELNGPGARCDVDWVFYARYSEEFNLSCTNIFNAPEGRGQITMKGVAQEKATINCRGMINIGLKGKNTDTYLTQNILMLDPAAKVNAVPGLEIKTNDVKASHSASISRVTEEDLFYFASRGIDEKEGKKMYTEGFLGDLTNKIENEEVRQKVMEDIAEKYEKWGNSAIT